ncbi:MAG: tRNA pseudouridine(55) synthase TruB [Alphaproteobacteria bacterium]
MREEIQNHPIKPSQQQTKIKNNINGWIILDKPQGITSTYALTQVKKILKPAKAGHSGTLDPLATGVLPLAFGKATKTIPWVLHAEKTYQFTISWGAKTDSDDSTGTPLQYSKSRPAAEDIIQLLPQFTGQIAQRPPAFSAIKQNGIRSYTLARRGQPPQLPARNVVIRELKLLKIINQDQAIFHLHCASGTYVRSIARDLGDKLGCLGHVSQLRRLSAGPFTHALTLEQIQNAKSCHDLLLPLTAALSPMPAVQLAAHEAQCLAHGQSVSLSAPVSPPLSAPSHSSTEVATDVAREVVAFCGAEAIAIATLEGNTLKPQRVFT